MQIDRHEGVTFLLDLVDQPLDLFLVQQQFARACGLGVDVGGCGFERVDQAADDEQFAIADHHITVCELHLAFANGLDFPALQHHAGLVALFKKIVKRRFFVLGDFGKNRGRRGLFGCGHGQQMGPQGRSQLPPKSVPVACVDVVDKLVNAVELPTVLVKVI